MENDGRRSIGTARLSTHQVDVRYYALKDVDRLKQDWKALERNAAPTIFLSWQWIGSWIETYQLPLFVLEIIDQQGVVVGLALLCQQRQRKWGFIPRKTFYLHQAGVHHLDQIWIEYNGILSDRSVQSQVEATALNYLRNELAWDEWVISGIAKGDLLQYQKLLACSGFLRWSAPCYGVNLSSLRQDSSDYRLSLSSNTRYQINRSQRFYQQHGVLSIKRPVDVDEALRFYEEIGPLHIQRWSEHAEPSGFLNPDFVRFHETMIKNHWPLNIDILKVHAGGVQIALIYNFIFANKVYFYLGVFKQESDNKLKPGLLAHTLCIEEYKINGFDYYDFMGGEEQYKSQLGVIHNELVQFCFVRNYVVFLIETALKKIKRFIFK